MSNLCKAIIFLVLASSMVFLMFNWLDSRFASDTRNSLAERAFRKAKSLMSKLMGRGK